MDMKQHLISRGMNPDLYRVQYDSDVATFLLYNLSGQLTGYQQYRPSITNKKCHDPRGSRYFTYIRDGFDGVFGLEVLDKTKTDVYITEGLFKAAVLHRLGFNSIAVLTNHPKRMLPWFRILKKTHNLIAIGDNDVAGKKLVSTIGNGFCSPIDIDEMSDADIFLLLAGVSPAAIN